MFKPAGLFSHGYTLSNFDLERLQPTDTQDGIIFPTPLPWNRILDRIKEICMNNTTAKRRAYSRTHCNIVSATRHGLHWYVVIFNCELLKARIVEPTESENYSSLLRDELMALDFDVKLTLLQVQKEDDNWRCGYYCLQIAHFMVDHKDDWMDIEIPSPEEGYEQKVWYKLKELEKTRKEEEEKLEEERAQRAKEARMARRKQEQVLSLHESLQALQLLQQQRQKDQPKPPPKLSTTETQSTPPNNIVQSAVSLPPTTIIPSTPPRKQYTPTDGPEDALDIEQLCYDASNSDAEVPKLQSPFQWPNVESTPTKENANEVATPNDGVKLSFEETAPEEHKEDEDDFYGDIFTDKSNDDLLPIELDDEVNPSSKQESYDWMYGDESERRGHKRHREDDEGEVWLDDSHKRAQTMRQKLASLRNRLSSVTAKKQSIQRTEAYQRALKRKEANQTLTNTQSPLPITSSPQPSPKKSVPVKMLADAVNRLATQLAAKMVKEQQSKTQQKEVNEPVKPVNDSTTNEKPYTIETEDVHYALPPINNEHEDEKCADDQVSKNEPIPSSVETSAMVCDDQQNKNEDENNKMIEESKPLNTDQSSCSPPNSVPPSPSLSFSSQVSGVDVHTDDKNEMKQRLMDLMKKYNELKKKKNK